MKIFFYILYFISILFLLFAPNYYNLLYNESIGVVYITSVFIYLRLKRKKNYFDFDTIFLFAYTITFFIYPIFLYPINPQYFTIYSFDFNNDVITRSTALSNIGALSYMLGNLLFKEKTIYKVAKFENYPSHVYLVLSILLFLLFLVTGGYSSLKGLYGDNKVGSGIYVELFILTRTLILLTIMIQFIKIMSKSQKVFNISLIDKNFILFIITFCLIVLSSGSRGAVLNVILVIAWFYYHYYRKLNFCYFLLYIIAGALILALIGKIRVDSEVSNSSFVDIFMDLIICNRNNFIAIDYVDNHGLSYGKTMLACVLRFIPFLSGIVHSLFNLDVWETSSSLLITAESVGKNSTIGFGTSIIADVYLAFGTVGVIVFMFYLGKFIHYLEYRITYNNIYSLIIYLNLMAQSVFIIRGEFFYPLGPTSFSIILFYFINKFFMTKTKVHKC